MLLYLVLAIEVSDACIPISACNGAVEKMPDNVTNGELTNLGTSAETCPILTRLVAGQRSIARALLYRQP